MVKEVTLSVSDDSYKELLSLSDFLKLDVETMLSTVLNAIGTHSSVHRIVNLSKEYRVPVEFEEVMANIPEAGLLSKEMLFNPILEKLKAKGLYYVDDAGIDFDEADFWFHAAGLMGSELKVDSFFIHMNRGHTSIEVYQTVETGKSSVDALGKLKEIIENESVEYPSEFYDIDYEAKIDDRDEEFWELEIFCWAGSLDELPSIKAISDFIKQVFKKAGIE